MTTSEAKTIIGEEHWDEFIDWMIGQTHGVKDGEPDYYVWDVMRFVRLKDIKI